MLSSWKTIWDNPWVRRPVLLALALTVVLGACWWIIDMLGKQAWEGFEKQLATEGETADFRRLLSPQVPDAENFCAIPALRNLAMPETDRSDAGAQGQANRARIEAMKLSAEVSAARGGPGLRKGLPIDLAKLAGAMRKEGGWPMPDEPGKPAEDVNAGLRKWDAYFAELAAGLDRPRAQWTPALSERAVRPYLTISTPHLVAGFSLSKLVAFRAAVAGAAGDLPRAIEALRIAKRLSVAFYDDPMLIDGLVAQSIETMAISALWEIAWSQQGTPETWSELELLVRTYDVRTASLRVYRGEFAVGMDIILYARDSRADEMMLMMLPGTHSASSMDPVEQAVVMLLRATPPGLFDSVATEFGSKQMEYLIRPLRDEGWAGMLRGRRALEAKLNAPGLNFNLPSLFGRQSLRSFSGSVMASVYGQVLLDQAAIVCVLERARLVSGVYPASLAGLTLADGTPLPQDACTGRPMHYRLTADRRYVLWSEGFDGVDDNADRGQALAGPTAADFHGDWVWGYSESNQ